MGVLTAWLAEIAIITWRDLNGKQPDHTINGFPLPADYLATFMVFGTLGLVGKGNPGASRAASLAGWAYVVATLVNALPAALDPSGSTTKATGTTGTSGSTTTPSTTIQPTGGSNAG